MYPDIDDEGQWAPGAAIFDPETGKPRLLSDQCADCVGRPGNLMYLDEGRLKGLIEGNTGPGRLGLICHRTLPWWGNDVGPAYCRWFYEHFGQQAGAIRIWERLGGFTEVPPPVQEGDDAADRG